MLINNHKQKNTSFIMIISILVVMLLGIALLSFYLASTSSIVFYKLVLKIILIGTSIASLFVLLNGIYVLMLLNDRQLNRLGIELVKHSIGVLYPRMLYITQLFGLDRDNVQKIFSEINNRLILSREIRVKPEEILILLPHCLQKSHCKHKITNDIYNCRRCGACDIDFLIGLRDKYGVNIFVATGGTLARKIIVEQKPKAIIAVACERDLSSGILDIKNIPVIGLLNDRPEGPCVNTRVKVDKIEETIKYFIGEGE
ncbi:MAG: hypothetical protein K0R93_1739 [Anaerosolibacter sp.]|jgi:hypothetical protein|uniref:DUF116 domain-containing protein n=1 Tax=Anaerosolibacter sp. TaxID=1872527 RepID=UPI0026033E40|nr:DUF116 domain-containing protein [Anaerosolibacter sp.]MDF2546841.1 hypothetical protein [Anaerosolibacter sp.]